LVLELGAPLFPRFQPYPTESVLNQVRSKMPLLAADLPQTARPVDEDCIQCV